MNISLHYVIGVLHISVFVLVTANIIFHSIIRLLKGKKLHATKTAHCKYKLTCKISIFFLLFFTRNVNTMNICYYVSSCYKKKSMTSISIPFFIMSSSTVSFICVQPFQRQGTKLTIFVIASFFETVRRQTCYIRLQFIDHLNVIRMILFIYNI